MRTRKALTLAASAAALLLSAVQAAALVVTFSPGVAYQANGQTQTVQLEAAPLSLSNRYVAGDDWHNDLVAQLFIGADIAQWASMEWRAGAKFSYVDDSRINGVVDQLALPNFNNLSYQYSVQSFAALATVEALFTSSKRWQPYVDAGIGYANNRSYNYQETPLTSGAVAMEPFAGKGSNNFAYSIGAGLMVNLNKVFAVGIGYEFADMGSADLGVSPAQDTMYTLNLRHVYLNQLLLHFSLTV